MPDQTVRASRCTQKNKHLKDGGPGRNVGAKPAGSAGRRSIGRSDDGTWHVALKKTGHIFMRQKRG